ncbi:MAG: dihydrodipicolinate synthase family protein [Bryobacteraceae bacterium]|jgi:4-hydroxy-tetrahydrodipicolinate synthase
MQKLQIGPINAATPTPLNSDGGFDRGSARRLCRRWIDLQLDGVLILGNMGEGGLVSDETRSSFIETALAEAGDKLTIFVSAADASLHRMRERALAYASMGAPCVVLCIAPGVAPQRAVDDVKRIADACPVPCAYYDAPSRTGTALMLNEILSILAHPNIVAFKDSSASEVIAQGVTSRQYRPAGVSILDGVEYRTAFSAALGYDGVLHGGGVLTACRVRAIWDLAKAGRFREALELDRQNALFLATVYNRLSRPLQNTIGQKYVLQLLGVLDEPAVAVDQSLDDNSRARIAQAVNEQRAWLLPAGAEATKV